MRKKLKMWVLAIAAAGAFCLSGTDKERQRVYADTQDVNVEIEDGYVSEDGKWDCKLVKHEYESDGEIRQIVEISIASYRETVEYGATELTIPEKMRVRRDEAEEWSEEYYVTCVESMDSSAEIKSNVKNTTSVTIPQTVVRIGGEAFSWMTNLQEVKISSVTDEGMEQAVLESYWLNGADIGYYAFYQCEKLTSVEIPSVIQEIGNSAFAKCERLESVNLPNGLCRIGNEAFSGCAFTEISLPESITEIGAAAFSGCAKLTAIEFPPELTELAASVVSGCEALTEITVPSKVTAIGDWAFYGCLNVAEITFAPDAPIYTIGSHAFACCENLTDISLPDTITEIGAYAFDRCKKLTSVKLPEQLMEVPSHCFSSCESLISVVVPNSVGKIADAAFYTCTSLETVVIPKDTEITYLDDVFLGCDTEKLTIYTEEGSFVMENLDANINFHFRCIPVHGAVSAVLETEDGWKYMKDEKEGIKIVGYDGGLENLVIPEFPDADVTSVSGRICQENTAIKSIQLPDTVTYIGADAFHGCTGLTEIHLPSDLAYIGDNALKGCGTIKNNNIPENIKYIGEYAFCGWTELEKAVIPADVEKVGEHAFDGCAKLESVEFKGVSETNQKSNFEIGGFAFRNCGLKSLTIPGNCNGMNSEAFAGNINLKTVVLPDDMSLADKVFADCSALESINLPLALPNVCEDLFRGCENLSRITIPEGVEIIDNGAFYGCTSLSEIRIPETVTFIGKGAFSSCSSLTKATIPSKTTEVRENAFTGCPTLTIYTVSDSDALRYAREKSIPYVLLDGGNNTGGGNGSEADSSSSVVTKVTLEPSSLAMETGEERTITVKVDVSQGSGTPDQSVTWSSGDQTVATVANGKVTAKKAGTTTITATAKNGVKGECKVTVIAADNNDNKPTQPTTAAVESITLNKTTVSINKGEALTLTAVVNPPNATDQSLTWTSSKPKVAAVDANGKVKAVDKGTATITVTAKNGVKATCKVNVTVPAKSVGISTTKMYIVKGKKASFRAVAGPEDTTDAIQVKANNKNVTVKLNKKTGEVTVTAKKAGSSKITVSAGSAKKRTVTVTVANKATKSRSVKLNKKKATVNIGKTLDLKATMNPRKSTDTLKWTTSNQKVAAVDKFGRVTAKKQGTATITVKTSSGRKATCKITVPSGVKLKKTSATIKVKKSAQIQIKSTVVKGDKVKSYKSSNPKVAKADKKGKVTGVKKGKATITVTMKSGSTATFKVTVK